MGNIKVGTGDSNGYSPGAYYKSTKPAVVDINNSESLKLWSAALGISERDLINAVRTYGSSIKDIRLGLRQGNDEVA